jgi:hypothetical protein
MTVRRLPLLPSRLARVIVPLLGLLIALLASITRADTAVAEYQLKAAYLFNFAKFTEWPAAALPAGAAVTVCVTGRDPFGEALAGIETKTVQNHPVRVRRGVRIDDLRGCHLVFVGESEERRLPELFRNAEAASALTLGDTEGFVDHGGTIGLVTRDNRILFDVNMDSARRAGLRLSSQMLKLARTVKGKP